MAQQNGFSDTLIGLCIAQTNNGTTRSDLSQPVEEKKIYLPDYNIWVEACYLFHRDSRNKPISPVAPQLPMAQQEAYLIHDNCLLCPANIGITAPGELMLLQYLAREMWVVCPNPFPITPSHLTIMTLEHQEQHYSSDVLAAMLEVAGKTNGYFSVLFNAVTGNSLRHLHLQATATVFPITTIRIRSSDLIYGEQDTVISMPEYDMPVVVVEGSGSQVHQYVDQVVSTWLKLDANNDVNLLVTLQDSVFRTFIFLRSKDRLYAAGKAGGMATFECAGRLVFTSASDKESFDNLTMEGVHKMIQDIAPTKAAAACFRDALQQALTIPALTS